ncbi:TPA: hypothetical protein EYP66_06575 [Candidatus Poribacteria bacterium]|nr:hypothetical protein [Candidatus Poribacteria bacterium]
MRRILFLTTLFLTISIAISVWTQGEILSFEDEHAPLWCLKAESPLLIGGYGDNFDYAGKNVVPYEGLDGHMMLTERSRDVTTHAIYADATRTSFYSPMEPTKGFIAAPDEKELHFVAP